VDSDSATLAWLTAAIVDPRDGGLEILLADTAGTAIETAYDMPTGVLTLSGVDSLENYQRVLRSLVYQNNTAAPDAVRREIRIVVSDGLDTSDAAVATVDIVGGTSVIWGYVYADVNNNGVKDPTEQGLPNVPITLSGTVSSVQLTRADGSYSFGYLPPGTYDLAETQPGAFIDGMDTAVEPYSGCVENDQAHGLQLQPGATARCDFGEVGLQAYLISKRLYLASSPSSLVMIHDMLVSGNEWIGFRADQSGTLRATLPVAAGESTLELYTGAFLPVVVGPGKHALDAPITAHQIYVLHAACPTPSALEIEVTDTAAPATPPVLDVNSDAYITPIDALLVINQLNSGGPGPAGPRVHLDVNRDGIISPLDALLVINQLNRQSDDSGEGEFAPGGGDASAIVPPALCSSCTIHVGRTDVSDRWLSEVRSPRRGRAGIESLWQWDELDDLFVAQLEQTGTATLDDAWARLRPRHRRPIDEELEDILEDIAAAIDASWKRQ
jgi:hypothetical protein